MWLKVSQSCSFVSCCGAERDAARTETDSALPTGQIKLVVHDLLKILKPVTSPDKSNKSRTSSIQCFSELSQFYGDDIIVGIGIPKEFHSASQACTLIDALPMPLLSKVDRFPTKRSSKSIAQTNQCTNNFNAGIQKPRWQRSRRAMTTVDRDRMVS